MTEDSMTITQASELTRIPRHILGALIACKLLPTVDGGRRIPVAGLLRVLEWRAEVALEQRAGGTATAKEET